MNILQVIAFLAKHANEWSDYNIKIMSWGEAYVAGVFDKNYRLPYLVISNYVILLTEG
ncbi:MAG: hypothetical protein GX638_18225 [Crenarchaeota archaeon]|jgi:hypothetical protein|nr:hypothetical protein [Thermoproteota archaeon]